MMFTSKRNLNGAWPESTTVRCGLPARLERHMHHRRVGLVEDDVIYVAFEKEVAGRADLRDALVSKAFA